MAEHEGQMIELGNVIVLSPHADGDAADVEVVPYEYTGKHRMGTLQGREQARPRFAPVTVGRACSPT